MNRKMTKYAAASALPVCTAALVLAGSVVGLSISGGGALADAGLGGFGNISSASEQPVAPNKRTVAPGQKPTKTVFPTKAAASSGGAATDPWGPVPTDKLSIANVAPVLLPYFNNAPVFGLPGTVVGDFWNRTQVTGDWGGVRTELARNGWFIDVYSTSVFQDVTSGGLKTGDSFVQNVQASLNVDTGRAGLWSGGLFHFTAQARYGSDPTDTFTVGSTVPQYTGLLLPGPLLSHDIYPSEYFLVQAITPQFDVVLGKISDIYIPDQTLFGDSYKYYFANFNFNKNPMTANFYNPTAWAALAVLTPTKWLALAGGVLDTNSQANNFANNAFDHVNLYATAVASYQIAGLPGQFSPAFNWTDQPKMDLTSPFGPLTSLAQVTQAVGVLVGSPLTNGLPINFQSDSWFAIANISQYLLVTDEPALMAQKIKSGQPLNGIGIFARVGYAPPETNPITVDGSVALVAHGLFDGRKYDSFGVGYYYNAISNDLKNDVALLTAGTSTVKDEQGVEIFYDYAITPAVRLIPSYQHIWQPLTAQVATKQSEADVFLARLTVAW